MSDTTRERRIEALFEQLFDAPGNERQAGLVAADYADVADAVRELLEAHDRLDSTGSSFLAGLDTRRAGELVDAADTPAAVSAIGRYPVLRPLARGGMGVVYLARDPRLERLVALKLLPPSRSSDPVAAERLFAEARAASALDHPNIGTVYEIAEAADGRLFIAMAYYDGETLRERMARGALAREDAIALGIQLADGLAAAHAHGIVHRDVKPENLIVTGGGVLKIVDFGVATSAGGSSDENRLARGTPAYMSPEQSRGAAVDHRTDLWAAGLVLYEMLTGSRPGVHDTLFTSAAWRGMIPELARLIQQCLAPDPEHRLESAAALAAALRAVQWQPKRRRTTIRVAAGIAAAAAAVLALLPRGGPPASLAVTVSGAAPAVAILPFEVRGDDSLDIWREGMVDLISSNLDGVAGLRAIDSRTMMVGWAGEVERDGLPDFERAITLARRTGAAYAVLGSIVSSGADIRLDARVHSLDDGRSLGTARVEGPTDSIFALVDRLSISVIGAVWQGRERPAGEVNLARLTTASLPALKAYLNGERALRHGDFRGAIGEYERAVAADSTFAFALYRLGVARGWIGDQVDGIAELATAALEQGMRHAGRLPERERLLLRAAYDLHVPQPYEVGATLPLIRHATQRYPDDPDAWYLLGEITFHSGEMLLLSREESEVAFQRAVDLDPGFALSYVHLIHNAFEHRPDSARAAQLIATYHRLAPGSMVGQENDLAFALAFGDSVRRQQGLAVIDTAANNDFASWSALNHPRFWPVAVEAIEAGPRPDNAFGRFLSLDHFRFNLGLGRARAALESLMDPRMSAPSRPAGFYRMAIGEMPVPRALIEQALATPAADTFSDRTFAPIWLFFSGAWAADNGRWDDHATGVARLRTRAAHFLAEGDSANARFVSATADGLEGYGLRKRGDGVRALALLTAGQRRATWTASASRAAVNETMRWWIGDLLNEMGRLQEAARYFESLSKDPVAGWRRARLYEQLGDTTRALEAYQFVAFAWRGADQELRPRAEEAEAAARRLTSRR